ncbi:MAG: bifunctional 4-hydroxy-3-methylbut-2-enyl diphosphate reductase/30S ribosomal protein S1 [Clostridia bacterium]|nr:bifunctional 4-hydroxy-3-methylbut-2-enyl diphosphate reductase/30S ribosomal protein S1 [Clostridia bacterium]
MRIVKAETAGFCFGVAHAVKLAFEALEAAKKDGRTVIAYGDLIHNQAVINKLSESGLIVIDDIGKIEEVLRADPNPVRPVVIIRAHGVGPEVYSKLAELDCETIDATCPFVEKIHNIARSSSEKGDSIFIIGNPFHPEVVGTCGWCEKKPFVSDNTDEIYLEISNVFAQNPAVSVSVLEQTTYSETKFKKFAENIKKAFDKIEIFDTICSATFRRQQETAKIASEADFMVVIGDRGSSNTGKLFDICRELCRDTVWVENADELPVDRLRNISFVGVTAGASTPDWIIEEVINNMSEIEKVEGVVENIAENTEAVVNEATAAAEETLDQAAETVQQAEETVAEATENVEDAVQETAEAAEEVKEAVENAAEDESFASLLEDSLSAVKNGDVVTGRINKIDDKGVYVDFGFKYEGFIAIDEFAAVPGHDVPELQIGDEVKAQVVKVNDKDCETILSKRRLDNKKNMELLEQSFAEKTPVTVKVTEAVKGGVVAFLGSIRIFIPASQLAERFVSDISQFVGKSIEVVIIAFEKGPKGRNKILGSRKQLLAAERAKLDETFWSDMYVGKVCTGKVKSLTPFGAFVDLGGYDGLIHLTELSWEKIHHPSEVVNVGDEVEVRVLECDPEKKRISLGYRKPEDDPWADAEDLYQVGDILEVTVVRFVSFGVFVNIATGVDGLVHISQISNQRITKAEDCLKIGQKVMAKIIETNIPEKKINLSIREVQAYDPEPKPEELDENGNPIVREKKERRRKDNKAPKGEKKGKKDDDEIHGDTAPASMGTSIGDILASKLGGSAMDVLSVEAEKAEEAVENAAAEEKSAE